MENFLKDLWLLFSLMKNGGKDLNIGLDMPEGWVIQSNMIIPDLKLTSSFGLYTPFDRPNISGHKLLEQLKNTKPLGSKGINILFHNKIFIPQEWKGKVLLFMGTIYRRRDGVDFVECMYYQQFQEVWRRSYFCLDERIGPFCAVPILKNVN